jgi:hypothetical protein
MIISGIMSLLLAFAYGGYRPDVKNQTGARSAGLPKCVTAATQAAAEFMQATPAGTVPQTLRPPDTPTPSKPLAPACGADPKTGQPYWFTPQTGQPCGGLPPERVVVRQPNVIRTKPVAPTPVSGETPEDRQLAAAYQREQETIQASTSIRNSALSRAKFRYNNNSFKRCKSAVPLSAGFLLVLRFSPPPSGKAWFREGN